MKGKDAWYSIESWDTPEENIVNDKVSGKNFERPGYQALKSLVGLSRSARKQLWKCAGLKEGNFINWRSEKNSIRTTLCFAVSLFAVL